MTMATLISKITSRHYAGAAFGVAVLAAGYGVFAPMPSQSAEQISLASRGRVSGTDGKPLAGIPVKAHLNNTSITVAVYTDKAGEYSFPSCSDVKPAPTLWSRPSRFRRGNKQWRRYRGGKTTQDRFYAEI